MKFKKEAEMRRIFFFLSIALILLSFFQNSWGFITKEVVLKDIVLSPRFSYHHYFLIENLNSPKKIAALIVDKNEKIYLQLGNKRVLLNEEALNEDKSKPHEYFSYVYKYDGRDLYVAHVVKYGPQKNIWLFRYNLKSGKIKTWKLAKKSGQVLRVFIDSDGKGNLFITFLDEGRIPYRIGYYFSDKYGEDLRNKKEKFIEKEKEIFIFRPLIINGKPYLVFVYDNNLYIRDIINGKEYIIDKDIHPSDIGFTVIKKGNFIWISLRNGRKDVRAYKLSVKDLKVLKKYIVSKLEINKEVKKLSEYRFDLGSFQVYKDQPIFAIVAKPSLTGSITVEDVKLPARFDLFVSVNGKPFKKLTRTIPFMFTNTMPYIVSSEKNGWVILYTSNRYIKRKVLISFDTNKNKRDILISRNKAAAFPKGVHVKGSIFRVIYPVFINENWVPLIQDINVSELKYTEILPPKDIMEKRLKERIKKYLRCQVDDNLKCIYGFFDPAFKRVYPYEQFLANAKKVKIDVVDYKYSEIKQIDHTTIAIAKGYIEFIIPEGAFPGTYKGPKRVRSNLVDIWVYVDDNWYVVGKMPMINYVLEW